MVNRPATSDYSDLRLPQGALASGFVFLELPGDGAISVLEGAGRPVRGQGCEPADDVGAFGDSLAGLRAGFQQASDMLWNPLVGPALRSALYKVLAGVPGVTVNTSARDSDGRSATEISRVDDSGLPGGRSDGVIYAIYENPLPVPSSNRW